MSQLPTIKELGMDLLHVSPLQKWWTIVKPFIFSALYFICAFHQNWFLAAVCMLFLLFTTYVSTSHDLVHTNLGINKKLNRILLSVIELLVLRSGQAFKMSHLNHHKYFPHEEDIEGESAHMTLFRTIIEGPIYHVKLFIWAWKKATQKDKVWLLAEGLCIIIIISLSIGFLPQTLAIFMYVCAVTIGSWVNPLFTVYIPHNAKEKNPLFQTKAFRGIFISTLFAHHNYHLEHHLYPMVPHQNWLKLAKRLDPYFNKLGVKYINI